MGNQQAPTGVPPEITHYNELGAILRANPLYHKDIMNAISNTKVIIVPKVNSKRAWREANSVLYLYENVVDLSNFNILPHPTIPNAFAIRCVPVNRFVNWHHNADLFIADINNFADKEPFSFSIIPHRDGVLIQNPITKVYLANNPNDCCRTMRRPPDTSLDDDNMIWYIILQEQEKICSAMNKNYAFTVPACRLVPRTNPLYNEMGMGYASQQVNGRSIILSDQIAQTWCNENPASCESVMLSYCNANPSAVECQCIFANTQPDYLEFKAKYPKVIGQASCFTKACQGTNFATHLIPASVAAVKCPDITNIEQTTNQNLIAQSGSTVINPTMTATQTATATTVEATKNIITQPTQPVITTQPTQPIQPSQPIQPTQQPIVLAPPKSNALLYIIIFVCFIAMMIILGVAIMYNDEEVVNESPVSNKLPVSNETTEIV
jgi:hypothetical protein